MNPKGRNPDIAQQNSGTCMGIKIPASPAWLLRCSANHDETIGISCVTRQPSGTAACITLEGSPSSLSFLVIFHRLQLIEGLFFPPDPLQNARGRAARHQLEKADLGPDFFECRPFSGIKRLEGVVPSLGIDGGP